jgi:hypothetical protein
MILIQEMPLVMMVTTLHTEIYYSNIILIMMILIMMILIMMIMFMIMKTIVTTSFLKDLSYQKHLT